MPHAPTSFDAKESSLADVLGQISSAVTNGAELVIDPDLLEEHSEWTVTMKFTAPQPLNKILQALNDLNGGVVFVMRDYGIFATSEYRARSIWGPTIPSHVAIDPRIVPQLKSK